MLLLVCATESPPTYAQTGPSLDPAKVLTQYVHDAWGVEDGLPQNSIYALTQTRDGYLWLGTEEGLARFDGARFSVFDKRTHEAFLVNTISALLEDQSGTLWVGTRSGGLLAYADGQFKTYTSEEGLSSDYITSLYEDQAGTLWIGTYGGGLIQYRDGAFTAFGVEAGFPGEVVTALYEDASHTLWVGTEVGLFQFEQGRFGPAPAAVLEGALIAALFVDTAGALWVSTREDGLYRLQDGTVVAHLGPEVLGEGWVATLFEDTRGSLWLGLHGSGLLRYRSGVVDRFSTQDGLTDDFVSALHQDREGSLWIGTMNSGLNRLRDGKFTPYSSQEGLAGDEVHSIYEDPDGSIWIGTGNGLNHVREGRVTTYTTADGLASNYILTVHGDSEEPGTLWIGTYDRGLDRLKDGVFTHYTMDDGLPSDAIFALYADSRGTLWIGTDAGVSHLTEGVFHTMNAADGLSNDYISAIYEGRDGSIWVGTYDRGVNRLKDGVITHYTTEEDLSNDTVLALYEDADGVLWIGTMGGGLNRLQDGHITRYTTRDGLFNDNIFVILEDDKGFLWMTCNKGIFRVSRQELNDIAAGTRKGLTSISYGKADGLKSVEGMGGQQPAGWKARDGRLWFSTINGAVTIDPAHIQSNPLAPPVVLEHLFLDNKPISLTGSLTLPPGSDKLEFSYTALSLAVPDRVQFRYILEGHDDEWSEAGTRREAFFTNLDPGPYTFHVIAANEDGVWNETGASLAFYLKPFFYQTTWFLGICLLALLLFAFTGYRLRIRQLKARERELEHIVDARTRDLRLEKEKTEQAKNVIEAQANKLQELDRFKTRFFANVSHEFRTPLTMIVGPLENALYGGYGTVDGPLHRQLEIMLRNALRLMRLINQLLDLSKLEAGKMDLKARVRDVVQFVEGVVFTCTAFAEQKNLTLTFESESDHIELYFEPDKLEKVFYNLLSNALKHTPSGGKITARIAEYPATDEAPDGLVEIRVCDTGKGIPEEELPYIFDRFRQVDGSNTREFEGTGIGLALVSELVLLHHGTISVASEVGVGTEFIVRLPKGNAHLESDELIQDDILEGEVVKIEDSSMTELAADISILREAFPEPPRPVVQKTEASEEAPLLLIVDDNADVREYIGSILNHRYRIATAGDGVEGLAQAQALRPDLIISDVMMPKMDGNTFCRRLKTDPELQLIPVILLTARATHELKLEGLEIGADDYMAKPFNARELLARVKNLLQLYEQEKALQRLNENLEQQIQEQLALILHERTRYEQELITAKEKAEASDRLKSAILDNMNHELRTPVTGILGAAEVLSAEAPEPLLEFTAMIAQSGHRLLKTLDALMELSNLEAERIGSNVHSLDLVDEARRATETFKSFAERKSLALRFDVLTQKIVPIQLDASAVQRILSSLIDNALKYTDAGAVVVEVDQTDDQAVLRVRDTGIGIGTDFQPHLFKAFTQESTGLSRTYEGCGLGLTIAKRLTDLMGGALSFETKKGAGSVFTVSFPMALSPDRPPQRRELQPARSRSSPETSR